jgi:hypothetical protein
VALCVKMIDFGHVHHPLEPCRHGARAGRPLQPSGRDARYMRGIESLKRLL